MNKTGLVALLFCFPMFADPSVPRLTRIDEGGLCGYAAPSGKVIVQPQYRSCDEFSEGLAFVELDAETKGVIDTSGKLLFRGAYYDHGSFHNGLAPVYKPTQLECVTDDATPNKEIHSDEERKQCPPGHLGASLWRGGNWGYIDAAGKMAIPARFQEASDFHEGLARVGNAFIDSSGQEVIPATSDFAVVSDFSEGIAVVSRYTGDDGSKFGYINKQGAYLVAPVYDYAEKASDGRGLVKTGSKFGYIDSSSGNLTIAPQYDQALSFSEGLAPVRQGEKWGYIDAGAERIFQREDGAKEWHYELDRDGFRLETRNYSNADGVCCEAYPFHYQVKGGTVARIPPVAFRPRNFVGVWANMPWEEAAQFSDARNLPELRAWHEKMQWHHGDPDSKPNISAFGPLGDWSLEAAEACDASDHTWQVELSSSREGGKSVHFIIEQTDEWTFVMRKVGFEGLDGCHEAENPRWKSSMFTEAEWHPF